MLNFAGGGLGGGAVLGLAILYLLMAMDKTLHTEGEVETYLKLPVLASLPMFDASALSTKNRDVLRSSAIQTN